MDLTTTPAPAMILHGVNCQHAMGAGVAKALYEKWSKVRSEYITIPKSEMKLGLTQLVEVEPDLYVMNCFTQNYYGRKPGFRYADPIAIRTCILKSIDEAASLGIKSIYMNPIGCGNGGLDFDKDLIPILNMIEILYPEYNFYVCKF